jgi:hypothetical protein
MLSDKRLYDGKGLTTAWCAYDPSASEGVHHIAPAFSHPALIIEDHRDIDAVPILNKFLTLLEALVLEVESVFTQLAVEILGNGIEASMDTHNTCYRTDEIQQTVQTIACNSCSPMALLQEDT